jgi:23S rRNA (cytidine1920-2'-O)/16S rRNA (cytidine1409-2'-O)-methyltransferase
VYAVDVGSGQLAPALKADPRVSDLEKTDIRLLSPEKLEEKPGFAACDVSFISLRLVLPAIGQLLAEDGEAVVLIKPQFEAGRSAVGRGGLVKDPKTHLRVLQEMVETFKLNGFTVAGMTVSPIHGGDGNIEFLAWLRREGEEHLPDLQALVRRAHERK